MSWLVVVAFLAYEAFIVGAALYVVARAIDAWVWNRRHRPAPKHGRQT